MESTEEGGPVNHRHQGQQDSAGLTELQPERKPAGVQLEGCWRKPGSTIPTSASNSPVNALPGRRCMCR